MGRGYIPPQYCDRVKHWIDVYNDQPNQLPLPEPIPAPKACPLEEVKLIDPFANPGYGVATVVSGSLCPFCLRASAAQAFLASGAGHAWRQVRSPGAMCIQKISYEVVWVQSRRKGGKPTPRYVMTGPEDEPEWYFSPKTNEVLEQIALDEQDKKKGNQPMWRDDKDFKEKFPMAVHSPPYHDAKPYRCIGPVLYMGPPGPAPPPPPPSISPSLAAADWAGEHDQIEPSSGSNFGSSSVAAVVGSVVARPPKTAGDGGPLILEDSEEGWRYARSNGRVMSSASWSRGSAVENLGWKEVAADDRRAPR